MKLISRFAAGLVLLSSIFAIFYITGNKVNQYGASDPLLTLPTSEALVKTYTPYLTDAEKRVITPNGKTLENIIDNYQATRLDGEIIDVYSPGPAIVIIPLTIILQRAGYDLVNPDINMAVQNRLAFLTSAVVLVSLYGLCRIRLNRVPALVLSHVAFFGSSIFANMGLAYFNLNIMLLFGSWVMLLLAWIETNQGKHIAQDLDKQNSLQANLIRRLNILNEPHYIGTAIGICLFFAFSARPSGAILIVVTFGYLLFNQRKTAVYAMGSALICLILFSIWSLTQYGQWLPVYFNLSKSNDAPLPMWVGILGNLVSPSRGIFIFMPWLLLIPVLMVWRRQFIQSRLTVWILIWFGLLLITVSRAVIWWGGASFGPRLLAETVPGLVWLLAFGWADLEEKSTAWSTTLWRPIFIGLFLVSGGFSIWVNGYQPFFNPFTAGPWQENTSGFPLAADQPLGQYFDWENSQWLANAQQICKLNHEVTQNIYLADSTLLKPLSLGQPITAQTDDSLSLETLSQHQLNGQSVSKFAVSAIFEGLWIPDGETDWSLCPSSTVYFIPADSLFAAKDLNLIIDGHSLRKQPFDLFLNDTQIDLNAATSASAPFQIQIQTDQLIKGKTNHLRFEFTHSQFEALPNAPYIKGNIGIQLNSITFQDIH